MTKTIRKAWEVELWEQGEAKGREKGRTEGRAEGDLHARRELLKTLLLDRFGDVPGEVLERIDAVTDPQRLLASFRQAMRIESLDELEL